METIKEAKQYLRNNFEDGVGCPCCGQFVKLYKRKLNSGMARTLILLYKHHKWDKVNVKDFLRVHGFKNNHDWTLLRYWGLIREIPNDDPEKKSSGEWQITDLGVQFVLDRISVKSHVKLYNSRFMGFHGDKEINIIEALGKHFNYKELMYS